MRRLCRVCIYLVVLDFCLLMMGMAESGIMRLFPILCQIYTIMIGTMLFLQKEANGSLARLIGLWGIYILLNLVLSPSPNTNIVVALTSSLFWVCFYPVCKYYSKNIVYSRALEKKIQLVFIIICLAAIYGLAFREKYDDNGRLVGSNIVFFPIMMAPWIALIRSSKRKWLMTAVMVIITLFSLKRSAFIILLLLVGVVIIDKNRISGIMKKSSLSIGTFSIVALLAIFLAYSSYSPMADMQSRIVDVEDDNGNGRLDIYALVLYSYENLPIQKKILGNGYLGVQDTLTMGDNDQALSAHNDYLEVLYDYGIVGVILFLSIHIIILINAIKAIRAKRWYAYALLLSYLTCVIMSLVSHLIIYPSYYLFLIASWAFCENQEKIDYEHSYITRKPLPQK